MKTTAPPLILPPPTFVYRDGRRFVGTPAGPIEQIPEPFFLKPRPDIPLLVLSCSETKAPTPLYCYRRFIEVYTGPLWLQVKAAGFPIENVAALSALYGFLEPGQPIQAYDRQMDEDISREMQFTGPSVGLIQGYARRAPAVYVVGGQLYRAIVEHAAEAAPDIAPKIRYATGSFLELRSQLGAWLRDIRE